MKPPGHRNIPRLDYGTNHERERERWRPHVEAGQVDCWRCGRRINPGTPWDMGHDDNDRTRYAGPEHRTCSRAAGAHKRNALARAATTTEPDPTVHWSRPWRGQGGHPHHGS